MKPFAADRWSGDSQLLWTPAKSGDRLDYEIPVAKPGKCRLELVLTQAPDFAIIQLHFNGAKLGQPIDLYDAEVVTTGVLTFGEHELAEKTHTLSIEVVGANPSAAKGMRVGIDYVRIVPVAK